MDSVDPAARPPRPDHRSAVAARRISAARLIVAVLVGAVSGPPTVLALVLIWFKALAVVAAVLLPVLVGFSLSRGAREAWHRWDYVLVFAASAGLVSAGIVVSLLQPGGSGDATRTQGYGYCALAGAALFILAAIGAGFAPAMATTSFEVIPVRQTQQVSRRGTSMRYKTAFRLGLKLIGVWMLAAGLAQCAGMLAYVVSFALNGVNYGGWFPSAVLPCLGQLIIGLYLFFGGRWIVDKAIPSNRPYCHECGYELFGSAPEGVCPECGTEYRLAVRENRVED